MVQIKNLKEKRLIIARYFINKKNSGKEFDEKDIFYMWNNYFPSDFRVSMHQKLKLQIKDGKSKLIFPYDTKISADIINGYSQIWNEICHRINGYVRDYTLEKCDADLTKLRHRHARKIKNHCENIKYGAKLTNEPKNKLSTYVFFQKNFSRSGNYEQVLAWVQDIKNSRKQICNEIKK